MKPLKTRSVTVSGATYEIRAWRQGDWFRVRAFREGQAVGLTFGVDATTRQDFELYYGDALEQLMLVVEGDLRKPR